MDINVTTNLPEWLAELDFIRSRRMRDAIATAINRTAFYVARDRLAIEALRVFDRPVQATVKGFLYRKATRSTLRAEVYVKDSVGKGTAPAKYLAAQIRGGPRGRKRSEKALIATYPATLSGYWVPGAGVRLNAYGNVSSGTIVRILSDVQAAETMSGFMANRTARSLRRNKNYRRERYFVPEAGSPLDRIARGVWVRKVNGQVLPALVFVRSTNYRQRLDFFGVGRKAALARFPAEFDKALGVIAEREKARSFGLQRAA